MPIDPERLRKLDAMIDEFLGARKDKDTHPVQFGDPPKTMPVAEPGNVSLDSPPSQIHGAGRRDLFK
jgi:hypothetical protein